MSHRLTIELELLDDKTQAKRMGPPALHFEPKPESFELIHAQFTFVNKLLSHDAPTLTSSGWPQHSSAEAATDNYAGTGSSAGKLESCSAAPWRRSNRYLGRKLSATFSDCCPALASGKCTIAPKCSSRPMASCTYMFSLWPPLVLVWAPVTTWICQCSASIRCTGPSGYGGWLTHPKQRRYGPLNSQPNLTAMTERATLILDSVVHWPVAKLWCHLSIRVAWVISSWRG